MRYRRNEGMDAFDQTFTSDHSNVLEKLWKLIPISEKRRLPLVALSLAIGAALEVVGVGLLVPLVNLLSGNARSPDESIFKHVFTVLNAKSQAQMLITGFLIIGVVILGKNCYLVIASYYQNFQIAKVRSSIEQRVLARYFHEDYSFHLKRNSSLLSKNLLLEVNQVAFGVIAHLITVLVEASAAVGIFSLLLYLEPLACCALVFFFAICGIGYSKILSRLLQQLGQARSDLTGDAFKLVSEGFGGIKEIKVLGHEKYFESRFARNSDASVRVTTRIETAQRIPAYFVELSAVLGLLLVVFILVAQGSQGQAVLSSLGLFVGASFRFVPALNRILNSIQVIKLGKAAIEIIFDAMVGGEEVVICDKNKMRFKNNLEFRDVSFQYDSQIAPVLKNISLSVSAGESLGVIGASGAGKTTLVDLLLGLLTPTSGQVLVDGLAVDLTRYSWSSGVGYVPQEIFLLDDTIRNNIALGISPSEISESQVVECLEIARLSGFVESLPEGLNTMIGEKGVRISGGQRQRIGIARALYHRPSLVVLDEATSALDLETEREFVETLEALHNSITMIVVSHRLTTLKYCDRTIRISGGQLVSEPNPAFPS